MILTRFLNANRSSLENALDAVAKYGQGLVAGKSPQRMLGHEPVATGVAGPEIADDIVGNKGGSLRRHHGIGANRAGRQIAYARVTVRRDGRQDFSKCWHRDLPVI